MRYFEYNNIKLISVKKENEDLKKKIEKYTSLKELNIQIDLLKDTPEGRELLKEKYGIID